MSLEVCPLDLSDPGQAEIWLELLDHYARGSWIGAPVDDEVNVGIRRSGERYAADGPAELVAAVRAAIEMKSGRGFAEDGEGIAFAEFCHGKGQQSMGWADPQCQGRSRGEGHPGLDRRKGGTPSSALPSGLLCPLVRPLSLPYV